MSVVINAGETSLSSISVCCLSLKKGRKMRKLRSNNRQHNNLCNEKHLSFQGKNLGQTIKYKKDVGVRTIQKSIGNTVQPCSLKCNKLTKISRQQIHAANKSSCFDKLSEITSKISPQISKKSKERTRRSSSRLKMLSDIKEISVADKIKSQFNSKKEQNILNEKALHILQRKLPKSQNKIKGSQGQNECNYNKLHGVSGFSQRSPNKKTFRCSLRLQSQEFSINNSENGQLSVSPESKKQPDILNEKTPCIAKKIQLKSANKVKRVQGQNEVNYNTEISGLSGFQHKPPDETVRSSEGRRLHSQECLKNNVDSGQFSVVPESRHRRKSTRQQKPKQLISPDRITNKQSSSVENTPTVKKRCVQKSSAKLRKPGMSKSFSSVPIDDLALSHITASDLALSPFIKRQTKSDGYKLPGRNTLKRKRFIIETMKKADEEYEDDIYEPNEFTSFKNIFPDTSGSELSYSVSTPKLGIQLSPLIRSKTPVYKDCFSPTEYALSRKVAEECFHRNKKRKKKSKSIILENPEKRKLEFNEVLENACKAQKEVEKLAAEESYCEDNYFTDNEI